MKKAFAFLRRTPQMTVYAASTILLACDALQRRQALGDANEALAKGCQGFLVSQQTPSGGWRYGTRARLDPDTDASNTHFALFGLHAASRLGLRPPQRVFERAARLLVATQEKDGPEVDAFPVPGADFTFAELAKIEKAMRDEVAALEKAPTVDRDAIRTIERRASEKLFTKERPEGKKVRARGWSYLCTLPFTESDWRRRASDSMTAAGMGSLLICKAHLEGKYGYEELRERVDDGIRDAASWLTHRAKTKGLSPSPYVSYAVARAASLALVPGFGDSATVREIDPGLERSPAESMIGVVPDAALRILVLAEATTRIVKIPVSRARPIAPPSPGDLPEEPRVSEHPDVVPEVQPKKESRPCIALR